MLPKIHIGAPKPDHWAGLIDGVYAIGLTILALEMPNYLEALATLRLKGHGYAEMAVYLFIIDITTYCAVFFVLYELWSFHRAVISVERVNSEQQTQINALILVGISFIPAGVAF